MSTTSSAAAMSRCSLAAFTIAAEGAGSRRRIRLGGCSGFATDERTTSARTEIPSRPSTRRDYGGQHKALRAAPFAPIESGWWPLPAVVGEGLVGLRHAVDVVLPLPGVALLLGSVEDLVRETLGHGLLPARPRDLDEPADRQRSSPAGRNLDRHLVGGTANAA